MANELNVDGVELVLARLMNIEKESRPAAGESLYETYEEHVMGPSQEIVPVDVGTLKNSKYVEPPDYSGGNISVTGGYGGQAKDYALEQHERLDFHHEVGEAKFLEKPLVATKNVYLEVVGQKFKQKTGI